jgi:hypothetical protein
MVRDDDAAEVGDSGEDMAITVFPHIGAKLQSVAYPTTTNFRPNI